MMLCEISGGFKAFALYLILLGIAELTIYLVTRDWNRKEEDKNAH